MLRNCLFVFKAFYLYSRNRKIYISNLQFEDIDNLDLRQNVR